MRRRQFLQVAGGATLLGMTGLLPACTSKKTSTAKASTNGDYTPDFPLMDLHVHRSEKQSAADIVAKSQRGRFVVGVMENVAPWGITNDTELKAFLDEMRQYPVYVGLQPMSPGWSKNLSAELIAQADYIAMDPQIVPDANKYHEDIHVWEYTAYIDDPDQFMDVNLRHYMTILEGDEPLDIFACPLFLPPCIEREYDRLWTDERLQQVLTAAKKRGVAIEINDAVRVPHADFIKQAKAMGLKFTFGSDTRDDRTGRLDYCKSVARECELSRNDFFIPKYKGTVSLPKY